MTRLIGIFGYGLRAKFEVTAKLRMRKDLSDSEIADLPEDTVARRIVKLRMSAKMTQEEFSEMLGFSSNYYGQVERGKKGLSKHMADKLREYCGVSYNYLFQGISPEQISESSVYDTSKNQILKYLTDCGDEECELLYPIVQVLVQDRRRREMKRYASHMETKKRPGRPRKSRLKEEDDVELQK